MTRTNIIPKKVGKLFCSLSLSVALPMLQASDLDFAPAAVYDSGGFVGRSVAVADVNGDGKPDVVVANNCANGGQCSTTPGTIGILLGNGNGTFQQVFTYGPGGNEAFWVTVADVNGDGSPDLVVANQCANAPCFNGSVGVLLGNGNGTFQPAVAFDSGGFFTLSRAVADVNGDGKLDVLVGNACISPLARPLAQWESCWGMGPAPFSLS